MSNDTVIIENNINYLFISWLGWDYNFWTVILTDIILFGMFIVIAFVIIVIYAILEGVFK